MTEGYWGNACAPQGHTVTLGQVVQLSVALVYSSVKGGYTTCFIEIKYNIIFANSGSNMRYLKDVGRKMHLNLGVSKKLKI